MSTITPNTSLTTLGDITSDQSNGKITSQFKNIKLAMEFFDLDLDSGMDYHNSVPLNGNELERLEAQRKAIEAKIAAELTRRQMKMEGNEATPKAKGNFGKEKRLSEAKQKEEDKLSKVEAENRLLKAELKQRETLDELIEMKTKVAKMEQQENALIEQIQKLEEEQKKCLDKYDELEKELARKYKDIVFVNHQMYFVDPNDPRVHTQDIEATKKALKKGNFRQTV
ncbi:hypothetical protein niasHT_005579 [Heterodera trifolii]|uniref:Uncharacterized protein n=1 Tax=Heterodera trifolii TaxID=157864 RepID=A0ABD2LQY8_9BILA